jgi:hypothetical protein
MHVQKVGCAFSLHASRRNFCRGLLNSIFEVVRRCRGFTATWKSRDVPMGCGKSDVGNDRRLFRRIDQCCAFAEVE